MEFSNTMTDKLQPRSGFDRALSEMRDNVVRLSTMVDKAIERSIEALKNQDIELAHHVVADDKEINTLRYKIEEDAYKLMAMQNPLARDLRVIVTAIHITVELERIADHAAGVAKLSIELANEPLLKPLIDIPRMAEISREMLHDSIGAYLDWNRELALEIVRRDAEVDVLDKRVYHELLSFMLDDQSKVNRATYLLWVSHNVERIADRITNICERIIYMVTGDVYNEELLES
jgi:phosphate transport system protein